MSARPGSFQFRLFLAFALVTVLAAALSLFFSRRTLYQDRLELTKHQALAEAAFVKELISAGLDDAQEQALFDSARALSRRLTLTDPAGRVLRDSDVPAERLGDLDNHNDRLEIQAALASGQGISIRHSNSLGIDAIYAAVRLESGGTLRIAVPMADIERGYRAEVYSLSGSIVGVAIFCLLLSAFFARRLRSRVSDMTEAVEAISRNSLNKGRYRLRDVPGREFLPLADAVNRMADDIEEHIRTVCDQQGQLEIILNSIHEGVLVLDPTGAVRGWNKALESLFPGMERAKDRQLIEHIPLPALQLKAESLLRARPGGEFGIPGTPGTEDALHFELPSGRFLVAHCSLPVEPNESLGAVIFFYDATELMRLERVRRDFVSNVSHELRTPLTAIAGYAETLMSSPDLDENYRRFASIIHKHGLMLSHLVSDLLALAHIENAREAIDAASLDPLASLDEAVNLVREQAEKKGVRIAVECSDSRPVLANAPLIVQVFRNLLENACRYSPEGGEVRVTASRTGAHVAFSVADDGPGIPRDELSRIFERFYQVKKERSKSGVYVGPDAGSGTGLGLAICKHIIERHGGSIMAKSPYEGASTAVIFSLPLAGEGA